MSFPTKIVFIFLGIKGVALFCVMQLKRGEEVFDNLGAACRLCSGVLSMFLCSF